jgi:hypothetical protein
MGARHGTLISPSIDNNYAGQRVVNDL